MPTPMGATTTTTPKGEQSYGRQGIRKDLSRIMVAHNIRYVAQASIHDPVDLSEKLKKAMKQRFVDAFEIDFEFEYRNIKELNQF